ncbi:MAG: Trk system potassium transporter TrkA [Bacteroidales bacterium]|nr:Trk system potassium transporter TrkA [Candidatus Sodaliphilus aphodohippi]
MKIVIAGAGEVGTYLAKMLSDENQDIIVIDTDDQKLANLENYNLLTYHGSATSFETLKDVGVSDVDLFIAVTPYEARNILACTLAKSHGARKTVARIDNDRYLNKEQKAFFIQRGVDHLIYPEYLAAQEIINSIKRPWVRNWFEMVDGELIVVGVKLRSNSIFIGKRLREVSGITQYLYVAAIKRNRETIIPGGDDIIMENDIAFIATTRDHINDVAKACGKKQHNIHKIIVMGGSEIAEQLCKLVGDDYNIKIFEPDNNRCQELADLLPDCHIINGDARDSELITDEGIKDYDMFIALGDSSETNILGCLMAKENGIEKTVAQVETLQYFNEAEALNIGTIINKKLLASSRIFQLMLDSDPDNAKSLALTDAEVAELIVKEGSKVTRGDIRDLHLSRNMNIAGLVRDGKGQLVTGDTRLRSGDHVVVFSLSGSLSKIEKMFN